MRMQFEKHVGPVAEGYGYKDLATQFKAEDFDPDYWADLIARSGARYAGICAIHHDGYAMWDSDVIDYCASKLGPKRDLLGEILGAIEQRGLKTFTSFHHARTYKHFQGITKRLRKDESMTEGRPARSEPAEPLLVRGRRGLFRRHSIQADQGSDR